MASIRKRAWQSKDGPKVAWVADYQDGSGTRRLKTFSTKRAAADWLPTAQVDVKARRHVPDSTSPTVGAACARWIREGEVEGLERSTIEQRRQHVDCHLLPLLGGSARLSKIDVERFRLDLLSTRSRSLARVVMQSLRAILRQERMVHIAADVKPIGADRRHKRRLEVGVDVPAPDEVRALIEAAGPKARALVCLAALAGLRASEIRGLRWSDLHLGKHPTVSVAQRADRWGSIGDPKSKDSQRTVPLGNTTALALKEWKLAQPLPLCRRLVAGTWADKPDMLGNLQRRLLTPLCAAAGVRRYSWHALRHYAVSSWLAGGIDPKTAQVWAGHATLALTLDTYGHMIPRADDHQRIAAAERALLGS